MASNKQFTHNDRIMLSALKRKGFTQAELRKKWEKDHKQMTLKMDRLLDLYLNGDIAKEAYTEKKNKFINERDLLQEKIDDTHGSTNQHLQRVEDFFDTAHLAYRTFKSNNLVKKKNVVKDIGWNLQLLDGNLKWGVQKSVWFPR